MQCPVCHGSGLSVANALFDHVVVCGGCQGSGWIADDDHDDDPPDLHEPPDLDEPDDAGPAPFSLGDMASWFSGTESGAVGAAAAFQSHVDRIFGNDHVRGGVPRQEDWGQLSGIELLQRLFDVDRRHLAEMPNALPGRAQPDTEARLAGIVADYRRVAAASKGGLPGLDKPDLDRKLANALRSLGQTRESLHDPDGAEAAYEEARTRYDELGSVQELAGIEASLRQLRLHRDRDVDATLEDLRARLATTTDGLARAELLIELGEVHASRHDDLEAEDLFRSAERELEPHKDRATGTGMADALTASLPMLMSGETPSLFAEFESITRVTTLLQRLYAGLTQVLAGTDPAEAQRYVELRKQLQGSIAEGNQFNVDFSRRMLDGLLGDASSGGEDLT